MSIWSSWGRYHFGVDLGIITGLLCFYPVAPYRFFAKDSVTTGWVWSPAVHLERALWYGRLGKSLHRGDPIDADWEAKSEANTLCKIMWDALAVCIFCENEYVVNGWCDKKGNFSSPDIYISHTKREVQPLEIVTICLKNLYFFGFWLCRPSCSSGIYKKFLVTLLFQSSVLTVKNAWLRILSIRYGRYITQQRL